MTAIVGRRFGRLTVVCEAARMHRKRRWICVCSCGAQTTAYQWSLLAGRSRSCGCLKSEELRLKSAELNERRGNENHGMHGSAEYKCWLLMKNRCYNPNSKNYAYAGVRGVRVCEAWRTSFQSFYDDMGARPPGTSCSAFALRKNLGLEIVAGVAGGPEGALRRVNWISKPPLLRRFGTALRSFVRHLCNTEISPAEPSGTPLSAPRVFLLRHSLSKCFRRLLSN